MFFIFQTNLNIVSKIKLKLLWIYYDKDIVNDSLKQFNQGYKKII